jgi:hypothetical protein
VRTVRGGRLGNLQLLPGAAWVKISKKGTLKLGEISCRRLFANRKTDCKFVTKSV